MAASAEDFRKELQRLFAAATEHGFAAIELTSGSLHRRVGGYPGADHRMPVCCDVMKRAMGPEDNIVEQPSSGGGSDPSNPISG